MKIIVENISPPVPSRMFDWAAYLDGEEEGFCGNGATAREAVNALFDLIEEQEP